MPGIIYTCNGPRLYLIDGFVAAVQAGLPAEQGAEYLGHRGCGHNLTSLIAAMPADGKTHRVECPTCGTVGEHRKTPDAQAADAEAEA